jgi:uncharacterized pyridoxamine 5'-phosphate oxidase family protein
MEFTHRQQRIHDFLSEQHVAVLSSVTPDNNPHGSVVYYTIDEEGFTTHILTKTGTRKYENLTHNDHVMLTVFEAHTQTIAQITGRAVEQNDNISINHVAAGIFGASLLTSAAGLPPIVKLQAGPFTTFNIEPVQIRMAVYARPDPGEYEDLFESLESFELNEEH